jgi:hypothetical protein
MRLEESIAIREWIQVAPCYRSAVNLGSGNVEQLRLKKHWVDQNIFVYLSSVGTSVVHCDVFAYPGVDLVVDLTQETLTSAIRVDGPKLVLLNNVLEHLPGRLRQRVCDNVSNFLDVDDRLIVSVPYKYPFHPDPIDTMFRPSPQQIGTLFPSLQMRKYLILRSGSFRDEWLSMSPFKRFRKLINPLFVFRRPSRYLSDLHRLAFLFQDYQISLVEFSKSRE